VQLLTIATFPSLGLIFCIAILPAMGSPQFSSTPPGKGKSRSGNGSSAARQTAQQSSSNVATPEFGRFAHPAFNPLQTAIDLERGGHEDDDDLELFGPMPVRAGPSKKITNQLKSTSLRRDLSRLSISPARASGHHVHNRQFDKTGKQVQQTLTPSATHPLSTTNAVQGNKDQATEAAKALDELESKDRLSDTTIRYISNLLRDQTPDNQYTILDPLWFSPHHTVDMLPSLPKRLAIVQDAPAMFPINFQKPHRHWALVVMKQSKNEIEFDYFNTIPNPQQSADLSKLLRGWAKKIRPGSEFAFHVMVSDLPLLLHFQVQY